MSIVGASLDESVSIPCRVSADPPNVIFEWTFSSSGERFEVPPGHYTTAQDLNNGGGLHGSSNGGTDGISGISGSSSYDGGSNASNASTSNGGYGGGSSSGGEIDSNNDGKIN